MSSSTPPDPQQPYGQQPGQPFQAGGFTGQPYGGAAPPPQAPAKRSWVARHKVLTAVLAVVGLFFILGGIGAAVGGGGSSENAAGKPVASATEDTTKGTALDPNAPPTSAASPAPEVTANPTTAAPTTKAAPKQEPTTPEPPAEPELTVSQENALGSAKSYLEFSGFSRLGLIEQLSSSYGDGYSKADATYAADHVGADWNEQAVRSAKSYLQTGNFSRSGLIQQLSSSAGDKFTKAQATYAADKVGL